MNNNATNKKAVHVKWAGKTIALGTFPLAEADEKCARAKALTRAWRSTIRPKPTREWVMAELERLNVRVVSGRPAKEADEDAGNANSSSVPTPAPTTSSKTSSKDGGGSNIGNMNANYNMNQSRRESITSSLLNAAEIARGLGFDANTFLSQRRNSSLPMSLFDDGRRDSNGTFATLGTMGSLMGGGNNMVSNTDADPTSGAQHHRPLVGGGSAAAYEAARADYYRKLAEEKNKDNPDNANNSRRPSAIQMPMPGTSRRLSSLGSLFNFDSSPNQRGDGLSSSYQVGGSYGGLSVDPNAHYEMLKLHHMNLLNEIQETTLMMNLYQQQQLQQQQQQRKLQQEQQMLAQQQLLSINQNSRIGMEKQANQDTVSSAAESKKEEESNNETQKQTSDEISYHEKQLAKIKAEIEEKTRMLAELENASGQSQSKRKPTDDDDDSDDNDSESKKDGNPASKKIKTTKL